jgi:hypothetical protein
LFRAELFYPVCHCCVGLLIGEDAHCLVDEFDVQALILDCRKLRDEITGQGVVLQKKRAIGIRDV